MPQTYNDAIEVRSLATLLTAGLSAEQAIASLISSEPEHRRRQQLQAVKTCIRQGVSLANALQSQRWCNASRRQELLLAEDCGRLPQALNEMATELESAMKRDRYIRTRLMVTVTLVWLTSIIAAFLAEQRTSEAGYQAFSAHLPAILTLMAGAYALRWLVTRHRSFWANASWEISRRISAETLRRPFEVYWADCLQRPLDAGMELSQAIRRVGTLLGSQSFRNEMEAANTQISRGVPLSATLNRWPLSKRLRITLQTGEHTGTLPQSLQHFVLLERAKLTVARDALDEWLPRLFYVAGITIATGFF